MNVLKYASSGVVTSDNLIRVGFAEVRESILKARQVLEKYWSCVTPRRELAERARACSKTLDAPRHRRKQKEAKAAARWYRDQAELLAARTDPEFIDGQLAEFALECAVTEASVRKHLSMYSMPHPPIPRDDGVGSLPTDRSGAEVSTGITSKDVSGGKPVRKRKRQDTAALEGRTRHRISAQVFVAHVMHRLAQRVLEELHIEPRRVSYVNLEVCECGQNHEVVESESTMVCPSCNNPKPYVDVTRPDENSTSRRRPVSRLRHNHVDHLRKALIRAQFREPKLVDRRIIVSVAKSLIAAGKTDPGAISIHDVHAILKKKKLPAMYIHESQICARLTGRLPEQLSRLAMKKIIVLFELLDAHFPEVKGDRKNFLRYTWVGKQELEILSNTASLPEKERQSYRNLIPHLTDVKRGDTKTNHYCKFEQMMRRAGINTSLPGIELLSETENAHLAH